MKIVTIIGARPQFIKSAAVSRAFKKFNQGNNRQINEILIHTGQHYDHNMSQIFFDELGINIPNYNLNVGSGTHGEMTGSMLIKIEDVLINECPKCIIVYGDTNSTLAGSLSAAKLHIPVVHIEAGLRSFNRKMPEEINRILTDHISTLLFCPTETAVSNLKSEGIIEGVFNVGDVMYDSAIYFSKKFMNPIGREIFILVSLHRAENTEDRSRLFNILSAINELPIKVIFPVHPRTRKIIDNEQMKLSDNVIIKEPFSYLSMLGHLESCIFLITDSGGLQKEAFFFGKKCITVRDETEWVELIECGANKVVGTNKEDILNVIEWGMQPLATDNISRPFGNGNAAELIVNQILETFH